MNILWIQPTGALALTSVFDDADPAEHAALLQERGDIPADWTLAGINVDWPDTGWRHESHRWDGRQIVVDYAAAGEETAARLRRERGPLLAALDVQFQRNLETGADNTEVIAEKNRLRNITAIAADLDLSQLRALSCTPVPVVPA